ncbi:NAD-dependent epimerase/dehydratase family protein [Candidatus Gracilibacteria bacterium]|nr:NAD-dependent epimerase/dehydratase family protein [Candidatus Gracilibacteria bacterium]MCF7819730.1 NAD-dependent epimerase/dehydratase family protein [Candidatus Gracilibacteria bacterium]
MKKILVTGGAGFIGSNFCNLNKDEYDIVALDNLFLGDAENLESGVGFVQGDACNIEDLAQCGSKFDFVVHFAGTSSAPMFADDGFVEGYVNSIQSFCQSLEFARKVGAKKFLYASTSSLYGNNPMPLVETQSVTPPNHYAVTKFCYEHCARIYHQVYPEIEIIGFRFMSVYGPHEESKGRYANMISQFIWDIARDLPPVIYGDGEQFRDFTNVVDVVQGIKLALEADEKLGNKVYNIGTGECCSFNDILKEINAALGKNIEPIYISNPVKEGYVRGQHADISKISNELGYKPTVDLQTGISHQVRHLDVSKIKETSSDLIRDQYAS